MHYGTVIVVIPMEYLVKSLREPGHHLRRDVSPMDQLSENAPYAFRQVEIKYENIVEFVSQSTELYGLVIDHVRDNVVAEYLHRRD